MYINFVVDKFEKMNENICVCIITACRDRSYWVYIETEK